MTIDSIKILVTLYLFLFQIKEMSDKISKYKTELKALTEQNKENERRAKSEQMKQKQLNEG